MADARETADEPVARRQRLAAVFSDLRQQRLARRLAELHRERGVPLHERISRLRVSGGLAVQAGLAAALAWYIAHDLLGLKSPVFAPIAAVGTLASSVGQRLRRTIELVIGVALGIAVGDALIIATGVGVWGLGLIVTLAILSATFLGWSAAVVTQAASTGVLLVTVSPSTTNLELSRVLEALIGGVVALAVAALLLPLNPLRVVDRAAEPALDTLARELIEASEALKTRDAGRARLALDHLRAADEELTELKDAIEAGRETAALSPARWGKRAALSRYVESAEYLHRILRNSGALVRRAVTMIEDQEPMPPTLPRAVRLIGEAISVLHYEMSSGLEPEAARERSLRAVSEAGEAYVTGVGLSGSVVVAQVRTIASDLIRTTGLDEHEDAANSLVRRAAGHNPSMLSGERPDTQGHTRGERQAEREGQPEQATMDQAGRDQRRQPLPDEELP
jgi:uncharacterized membrane protein YgaE (UPF0421/DUF939 family)